MTANLMTWHSRIKYSCMLSSKTILLVATILLAATIGAWSISDSSAVAPQASLAKGTWSGKMSGIGTLMMTYNISLISNMSGIFSGNTSRGEWSGKYYAIYRVERSLLDDIGFIKGNYTWDIDNNGVLSGEVNTKVARASLPVGHGMNFAVGDFVGVVIDFLIVTGVIFLIVKYGQRMGLK